MCGAPRALGESIVFCWGDALGLAYVGLGCPDSSLRGLSDQPELFHNRDLPFRIGARRRRLIAPCSIRAFQQLHNTDDGGGDRQ